MLKTVGSRAGRQLWPRPTRRDVAGGLVSAAFFILGALVMLTLLVPFWLSSEQEGEGRDRALAKDLFEPVDQALLWVAGIGSVVAALVALLGATTALAAVASADRTAASAREANAARCHAESRLQELQRDNQGLESGSFGKRAQPDQRSEKTAAPSDSDDGRERGGRSLQEHLPGPLPTSLDSPLPQQRVGVPPPTPGQVYVIAQEPETPEPIRSRSDLTSSAASIPSEGTELDQLIRIWEECRKDGRFHYGVVSRQLQQAELDFEVCPGSELDFGDAVIAVSSRARGELYLLPSFNESPEAVADWFHNQAPNARLARIDQLIRPAVMRRSGGGYELKQKGVVA